MSQIYFYAAYEDLQALLGDLERELDVKYVEFDHFDTKDGCTYSSYLEMLDLSRFTEKSKKYLILEKSVNVISRPIEGTKKYAFDQLLNPDSVTFTPGAVVCDQMLIHGNVGGGTIIDSSSAKKIFKVLQRSVKKNFKKVKSYWVGPKAYEMLIRGCRLTLSIHTPKEFDLKID